MLGLLIFLLFLILFYFSRITLHTVSNHKLVAVFRENSCRIHWACSKRYKTHCPLLLLLSTAVTRKLLLITIYYYSLLLIIISYYPLLPMAVCLSCVRLFGFVVCCFFHPLFFYFFIYYSDNIKTLSSHLPKHTSCTDIFPVILQKSKSVRGRVVGGGDRG